MSKRKLVSVDTEAWGRVESLVGGKRLKNPIRSRLLASMIEDYHQMNGSLFSKIRTKEFNDGKSDRMVKKILRDILE